MAPGVNTVTLVQGEGADTSPGSFEILGNSTYTTTWAIIGLSTFAYLLAGDIVQLFMTPAANSANQGLGGDAVYFRATLIQQG